MLYIVYNYGHGFLQLLLFSELSHNPKMHVNIGLVYIQKLPLGLLNTLDSVILNTVAIQSERDFMGLSFLPTPISEITK